MSVEENKQIVRQAFEALMADDLTPLGALLATDAVLHQCGFLAPIPASVLLQGGFPAGRRIADREVRLERIIGEDDIVALHWRTTGRFPATDPPERDGKPVSFPSMTFLRLENDRIAEIWNIQDVSTLKSQLDNSTEPAER